tara:strand:- start:69 stop:284 length:216 start_codon:yes stop_codon:yes gene_type:complete
MNPIIRIPIERRHANAIEGLELLNSKIAAGKMNARVIIIVPPMNDIFRVINQNNPIKEMMVNGHPRPHFPN